MTNSYLTAFFHQKDPSVKEVNTFSPPLPMRVCLGGGGTGIGFPALGLSTYLLSLETGVKLAATMPPP